MIVKFMVRIVLIALAAGLLEVTGSFVLKKSFFSIVSIVPHFAQDFLHLIVCTMLFNDVITMSKLKQFEACFELTSVVFQYL